MAMAPHETDLVKKWSSLTVESASSVVIGDHLFAPSFFTHQWVKRDTIPVIITRCCIKQSLSDPEGSIYPVGWVLNNSMSVCMSCEHSFKFLVRRKHHCRACGNLICYKCSKSALLFGKTNGGKWRVCTSCEYQNSYVRLNLLVCALNFDCNPYCFFNTGVRELYPSFVLERRDFVGRAVQ